METKKQNLDLLRLLELKKEELDLTDTIELKRLEIALQSIAKRMEYCKYHYDEFLTNTDDSALFFDEFNSAEVEGISIRTKYEANILAFLQNLHALIDCFPYSLNILVRVIKDIESNKIGWNKDFIKKYNDYKFFSSLDDLFKDETFQRVKGYVNRTKHKHLVRIKNNGDLFFEDFSYLHNGNEKYLTEQNVKSFIVECHDILIPKLLDLANLIKYQKEKEALTLSK